MVLSMASFTSFNFILSAPSASLIKAFTFLRTSKTSASWTSSPFSVHCFRILANSFIAGLAVSPLTSAIFLIPLNVSFIFIGKS